MTETNDAPHASNSKEATARVSVAAARTAGQKSLAPDGITPAGLRQQVTASNPPSPGSDTDPVAFVGSSSSLAKLQTYLPTGTWITFTTLQTWAFSLRPGDKPTSPLSSCPAHQHAALLIVIVLCAALAFLSCFIKRFVYDAAHAHVVYPPPIYFRVADSITEPVTGVKFPCRTAAWRYCWPLVNADGEFVYDESGTHLRVAVFRADFPVLVRDRSPWWRALFGPDPEKDIPPAPYLYTSAPTPPTHTSTKSASTPRPLSIDSVVRAPPALIPRWSHLVLGSQGGTSYIDLHWPVWGHALVSLTAFLSLALFSPQVITCLYPSMPDFLAPPLQTGLLAVLSILAAVAVQDRAVGFEQRGVSLPRPQHGEHETEVPEYLQPLVELVVWVGRQAQ